MTNNYLSETPQPKVGKIKGSWLITRSAWRALKLDKELSALPVVGFFAVLMVMIPTAAMVILKNDWFFYQGGGERPVFYVGSVVIFALLSGVGAIFEGAVIYGALDRFRGNDPTISSSIKGALRRGGSLFSFGVFSYIVGYIISQIAQRIPLVGGMVVEVLARSAWGVASFFAIPVVVSSQEPIGPIRATKESIDAIKKTWGESLVTTLGIGIVSAVSTLFYMGTVGMIVGIVAALGASLWIVGILGVIAIVGLIMMLIVFGVLSSFIKAGIYYYATTGESPALFDQRLMQQAFTMKKSRKLFKMS